MLKILCILFALQYHTNGCLLKCKVERWPNHKGIFQRIILWITSNKVSWLIGSTGLVQKFMMALCNILLLTLFVLYSMPASSLLAWGNNCHVLLLWVSFLLAQLAWLADNSEVEFNTIRYKHSTLRSERSSEFHSIELALAVVPSSAALAKGHRTRGIFACSSSAHPPMSLKIWRRQGDPSISQSRQRELLASHTTVTSQSTPHSSEEKSGQKSKWLGL